MLTERERIFVEHFLFHHEIPPLLSMEPGPNSVFHRWSLSECEALLTDPRILAELTRRRELQELENARQQAKASRLTPEFVRANLVDAIAREERSPRVRAIELGLAIAGILQKGELVDPPDLKSTPTIYRALQTTIMQRVTETITQTKELPAGDAPLPEEPKVLLASQVEILDY